MKKFIILGLFLSVLFLSSCESDYLETEPTQFISADQIAEASQTNPDLQAANISGIYTMMFDLGTGGTSNHDDFGQKGYDIYMDMLCGDMELAGYNYGWYSAIAKMTATIDFTTNENYKPWRYYYRIINGCNLVIDGLGGNDIIPELAKAKHYMGQAKAMRAYAYFYLANLFANKYEPTTAILPIYTSLEQESQPLSTTSDVYILIKSDLTDAISLLDDFSRSAKNEVDKYVAKGLLAYVALTTEDYTTAISNAKEVIDNGGFILLPMDELTSDGFNNIAAPGWMWGVDLTLDNNLDLISWWGQIDIFTYSYAWAGDAKSMDEGLYAKIPATDGRKAQFIDGYGDGNYIPIGKFYDPDRNIGGQREVTTDYVYMRIEEMYLILAEAYANDNKDTEAKHILADLLSERNTDITYIDGLSGTTLKDEIYLQWRIEMWGEGKSYLAMKRNKATITRVGHTQVNGSFSYDDDRLTFMIPQNEIQNNPYID